MSLRARAWMSLASILALASCTPMRIITPHPTTRAPFAPGASATLVLTALSSPMPGKARDRRFSELPARVGARFGEEGANIVEERDLTAPLGPGAWVLRVALSEMRWVGDGHTQTHVFEVSVFDASGAPLERVATDAGIVLMIDTSGRPPILRETYEVAVATDFGSRGPRGEEANLYDEEFARLLAELLYESLAPDLARAISTAIPYVQPVGAIPSVGGETFLVPN